MSVDGYKTVSHIMLIAYLEKFYTEFTRSEIVSLNQLRRLRNDIAYRGIFVNPEYLKRNKTEITNLISKLKKIVMEKIK